MKDEMLVVGETSGSKEGGIFGLLYGGTDYRNRVSMTGERTVDEGKGIGRETWLRLESEMVEGARDAGSSPRSRLPLLRKPSFLSHPKRRHRYQSKPAYNSSIGAVNPYIPLTLTLPLNPYTPCYPHPAPFSMPFFNHSPFLLVIVSPSLFSSLLPAWQYLLFTFLQMNELRSFVIPSTSGTATLEEVAKNKVGDTTTSKHLGS